MEYEALGRYTELHEKIKKLRDERAATLIRLSDYLKKHEHVAQNDVLDLTPQLDKAAEMVATLREMTHVLMVLAGEANAVAERAGKPAFRVRSLDS